ncbi:uncharacterized protein LOC126481297 [Schistocerca serialis cubense]|uniref:uncharacterized protein LOC126481297 n=1 Tax=Schistocerca serialis cubense TaxID=2023355 RepID=UPI00214EF26A|nr:uncharacterized protein LOC126481297 [Schistocerca serialis cubense]
MSAKYQKPPDHSNSEPFKEGRRNKVHPDIEIHTEEEINHPVLGKMKLVTIPVPNTHTGEDFTKGYMLFNDEESPEESDDFMLEDDTLSEREKRRSEAFTAAESEEDIISADDSWGGAFRASAMNPTQKNWTGNRGPESHRRMTAENRTKISPASQQSHWTKKCCTCGDPPEEECLRERDECGCGDSGALREDGHVKCTWRCCCC